MTGLPTTHAQQKNLQNQMTQEQEARLMVAALIKIRIQRKCRFQRGTFL